MSPTVSPISKVPELLKALTFTLSVGEYKIIVDPVALVKVPVTLTVFVLWEKPVVKLPELLTLPVMERVVVEALE